MFRRIARFVLWHHLRETLWVSGAVVVGAAVYSFVGRPGVIHTVVLIIGLLAALVFLLSLLLYRRRRRDQSI